MIKKTLGILSLALVISLAFYAIQSGSKNDTDNPSKDLTAEIDINQDTLMDFSSYTNYSPSAFKHAQALGKTVLFFAATSWCQTCSVLDKEITERTNEIPAGLTILKVDYDRDKETTNAFAVATQHTLVLIDQDGAELTRWVGGDFDQLISMAR